MTLNLILRRTHIYLALFLLPWFGMYGISSLPFSHPEWFMPTLYDRMAPSVLAECCTTLERAEAAMACVSIATVTLTSRRVKQRLYSRAG